MALTEVNSLGIKDLEVKTGDIAADAITGAKIADDAIDSEHYAAGSIDGEHIANDQIDSQHYAAASIDNEHLADDAVDSDELAAGSVDIAHLAAGTDGKIITWDANGDAAVVGPGTDGQVLTSTGAGSPPAFEDAAGGGELKQIKWEHIASASTGNSAYQDTGFEIDWTQTDASHYTMAKLEGAYKNTMWYSNPPPRLYVRLLRDGTEVRNWEFSHTNVNTDNTLNEDGGGGYDFHRSESLCLPYTYSDDTSQHTWKVQFKEVATTHYGGIELVHCYFSLQEYGNYGN